MQLVYSVLKSFIISVVHSQTAIGIHVPRARVEAFHHSVLHARVLSPGTDIPLIALTEIIHGFSVLSVSQFMLLLAAMLRRLSRKKSTKHHDCCGKHGYHKIAKYWYAVDGILSEPNERLL